MAENNSSGSDFDVGGDHLGGQEAADPLNRVDDYFATVYSSDSEDDVDFLGFQNEWVTAPDRFLQRNARPCTLAGGSSEQHHEETTAGYLFGLFWGDEVNILLCKSLFILLLSVKNNLHRIIANYNGLLLCLYQHDKTSG